MPDDWAVTMQYHELLRPFKNALVKNAALCVKTEVRDYTGAIWQVLQVLERLLDYLEGRS